MSVPPGGAMVPPGWGPPPPRNSAGDGDTEPRTPWHRYIAAVKRFKWWILTILMVGSAGALVATRLMSPEYEVHGTIWIQPEQRGGGGGPVGADELLATASWVDLFRSFRVAQPVITSLHLYLHRDEADSDLFQQFSIADSYSPGTFIVNVSPKGGTYALVTLKGTQLETGAVGDSIGRHMGWRWQPPAALLTPGRKIRFGVSSLADAADALNTATTLLLPDNSNFIRITMTGSDPRYSAAVLNAWLDSFIAQAADLKKRKLIEETSTISDQMQIAARRLQAAEDALKAYEQSSIRAQASAPTAPGQPSAGNATAIDPAVATYLNVKVQHDNLHADIVTAEQELSDIRAGRSAPDALLAIPSLMVGADQLRSAIADRNQKMAALRELQRTYTDAYKPVQDAKASLQQLDTQTIPQLAQLALTRLRTQDASLQQTLTVSDKTVEQVPDRLIDGERRRREMLSAAELYNDMQKAYEKSKLSEASAIPDVQILDRADPPLLPSRNTAPRILGMGIAGSLGLALALAVLLDRLDNRFRYPEQATDELGLPIIGTVPALPSAERRAKDPEAASQVVEAFRTIRLHLIHLFDPTRPMLLTISSPGAGEGKSLISSNLAMSFAEGGRRTLVIDGDIRRGQLHGTFGVPQSPGLLDYLLGHASLDEILRETDFERLTIVTCGTRRHRGPELLQSAAMVQLIAAVSAQFDTIIIDSPPLGAGIDPFALAHVTGNLMLVLRVGRSDRKMAQAKLAAMDRLSGVRQLGAVLNDVEMKGVFRYYSYLYGYKLDEGELQAQIPSQVGDISGTLARR